jgi:AcrR family transcriptional regulator
MNSHSAMRSAAAEKIVEGGKREDILDAALHLFAERGFHGAAVPLVAERAGVGAGTIYRYFPSKEALVNALYKRWKMKIGDVIIRNFPVDAPEREQFRVFWKRITAFARDNPDAFAFLAFHHHESYLDEESRELERAVLGPAIGFFEKAIKRQVIKPLPADLLLALVWGAFVGVIRAAREQCLKLTPELLQQAENCCWEAIRR